MKKQKLQLNQAVSLKERILLKIDKLHHNLLKHKSISASRFKETLTELKIAYSHLNEVKKIVERANAGTLLDRILNRTTNHLRIYQLSDTKRIIDALSKLSYQSDNSKTKDKDIDAYIKITIFKLEAEKTKIEKQLNNYNIKKTVIIPFDYTALYYNKEINI